MMIGPRVAVIDYGMGNVWSVISALKYLGATVELVRDPEVLVQAKTMILPGVGSFRKGMGNLKESRIDEAIRLAVTANNARVLGICLGMQLLGSQSTEGGKTAGLGLIANRVEAFTTNELGHNKIPHVGFNTVYCSEQKGLFSDLPEPSDFYFMHSYRMLIDNIEGRYATCSYGIDFLAAFEIGNICGAQFHPEKSQTNGLILLHNFLKNQPSC
jgi:imidazole glycerol-phosphate synthase subunit HisH